MEKIRRWTKNHRITITVVVAVLIIGLLASIGLTGGNQNNGAETYIEYAALYKKLIKDNEPATVEEADFLEAYQMALYYSDYYQILNGAYSEALAHEKEKVQATADSYLADAQPALEKAFAFYEQAIARAEEDSATKQELAEVYANMASAYMTHKSDFESAATALAEARRLDGYGFAVVYTNSYYLYVTEEFSVVEAYLKEALTHFDKESEEYSKLDQRLQLYTLLDSYMSNTDTTDTTDASDESDED